MYRFLLTRRWLRIHLGLIILVPAFFWLGNWQRDLFVEHRSSDETISRNLAAAPVPLATLVTPAHQVGSDIRFRRVTVTGTFDVAHQLLARERSNDNGAVDPGMGSAGGQTGYDVVTPLVLSDGSAVLVNRGWVAMGSLPNTAAASPAPPSGLVTVTGRLEPSETTASSGRKDNLSVPAGQVSLINTQQIVAKLPYPIYASFVELTAMSPSQANAPIPVAAPGGTSTTIYLVYIIQWWLFVVLTIAYYIMLIRREAAERRAASAGELTDGENFDDGEDAADIEAGDIEAGDIDGAGDAVGAEMADGQAAAVSAAPPLRITSVSTRR